MRHLNVSLTVWAKSRDSVYKPQFLKRKESRRGSNRGPPALPLGYTGSQVLYLTGFLTDIADNKQPQTVCAADEIWIHKNLALPTPNWSLIGGAMIILTHDTLSAASAT